MSWHTTKQECSSNYVPYIAHQRCRAHFCREPHGRYGFPQRVRHVCDPILMNDHPIFSHLDNKLMDNSFWNRKRVNNCSSICQTVLEEGLATKNADNISYPGFIQLEDHDFRTWFTILLQAISGLLGQGGYATCAVHVFPERMMILSQFPDTFTSCKRNPSGIVEMC